MKKSLLTKSTIIAAAVISATTMTVANVWAAPVGTENSTGSVTFAAPTTPLTINNGLVPDIDFGNRNISAGTTTYKIADADGVTAGAIISGGAGASGKGIEIADARGQAIPAGWKVTVNLGAFSNGLTNAALELPQLIVTGTGGGAPTSPTSGVTLIAGNPTTQTIMSAAAGDGNGLWLGELLDAELTVLAGTALAGTTTAQLDWVIEDTP